MAVSLVKKCRMHSHHGTQPQQHGTSTLGVQTLGGAAAGCLGSVSWSINHWTLHPAVLKNLAAQGSAWRSAPDSASLPGVATKGRVAAHPNFLPTSRGEQPPNSPDQQRRPHPLPRMAVKDHHEARVCPRHCSACAPPSSCLAPRRVLARDL